MVKSIITNNYEKCYSCGYRASEEHHIFFGYGKRKISEKYGLKVPLCYQCHRGTFGVHGKCGHELDMKLKKIAQKKFEEKYSHETFMKLFNKNYL